MKKYSVITLSLYSVILFAVLSGCTDSAKETDNISVKDSSTTTQKNKSSNMPDMSGWAEASQMVAKQMMEKYGNPNESTDHMLVWYNNGPWKRTIIYSEESKHIFPVDHVDVMEQVIDYKVSPERFSDLAAYDGSVTARRTDGELSAKCDKEGANFLAINLANDVATGKKSVAEARTFYAATMKDFALQNKMSPYMESFQFSVAKGGTADTDKHGVSEEENEKITTAMKQMEMKQK